MDNKGGVDFYFITKPIQYLIMAGVHKQVGKKNKILIVLNSFSLSEQFSDRIKKYDQEWENVVYINNINKMLPLLVKFKANRVFMDSDVGLKRGVFLYMAKFLRPKLEFNVVEEGFGTYRNDLYAGVKKNVLSFLGFGVCFGGFRFTKNIYVFNVCRYIYKVGSACNSIQIPINVVDIYKVNKKYMDAVFGVERLRLFDECKESIVRVYLSGWYLDREFIQKFSGFKGFKVAKFHPHIINIPDDVSVFFDFLVSQEILAEILIIRLSEIFDEVYVYHEKTSVTDYLCIENVKFERILK